MIRTRYLTWSHLSKIKHWLPYHCFLPPILVICSYSTTKEESVLPCCKPFRVSSHGESSSGILHRYLVDVWQQNSSLHHLRRQERVCWACQYCQLHSRTKCISLKYHYYLSDVANGPSKLSGLKQNASLLMTFLILYWFLRVHVFGVCPLDGDIAIRGSFSLYMYLQYGLLLSIVETQLQLCQIFHIVQQPQNFFCWLQLLALELFKNHIVRFL